jgi:hypothetical protein
MHLLWKRYSRSGYAPSWFYALLAAGFVALAAWAMVRGDWLITALAGVMFVVTPAGSRAMRRLKAAEDASTRAAQGRKEGDDG